MKIFAKSKHSGNDEYYNRLPLPTQVKRLGKFLAKNLTGVYKIKEPPNEYIIYSTLLYQVDPEVRKAMKRYQKEFEGIEETVYEMNIYYNITTYGKYIRVDIIQLDEYEVTLGFLRFEPDELISLPYCKQKLLAYTKKVIEKKYDGYEVLI